MEAVGMQKNIGWAVHINEFDAMKNQNSYFHLIEEVIRFRI
jgi:hypothetical protein